MSYEELIYYREEPIESVPRWMWIKTDKGAWDGPKDDWINSHKEKYLSLVKKFDLVVCAGGNQGMYPRLFSDMFKTVWTFEPDPLNFHCLVNNCQKDNIIKMNCALGAKPMAVEIYRETMENTGMHKIRENGIIPQLTLDSFEFPTLDLIQLDVEGLEIEVLRGGINTINKHKPIIAAERADEHVAKFLEELNYTKAISSIADTLFKPRN